MARKTRARSKTSVIEKSLRDAQKIVSSYIESGGKQVKETLGSLVRIFENQRLSDAIRATSRRTSRAGNRRGSARRPAAPARRRRAGAKTVLAKRARKPRVAAARASSAKRTRRTRPRKP